MSSSLDRVEDALRAAGSDQRHGGNWNCPASAHANGDMKPSLSVAYNGSSIAFYCHTGCTTEDILDVIGLRMTDLFDEPLVQAEPTYYKYLDYEGTVLFAKLKYFPKRFSIKHPVNGSGWEDGIAKGTPKVLYHLPEVKAAVAAGEVIYVVEGEKDADRLLAMGFAATTNFEGASIGKPKWKPDYTDQLAGAASVIIVADRDEVGIAHAKAVAENLKGAVGSIRIVQSRTMGKGEDLSDHLDAGHALEELVPLTQTDISAQYRKVNWISAFKEQPEEIEWLKEDFLEMGTLNSLFSKPGVGKSLIALEIALEVVRAGHRVMYIDDENRVSDTIDRLKAFSCKPEELGNLALYSFQGLPPLDTAEGGKHLDALAVENEPALIIMDTVSRMVEGEENAANTFLQLYRCSLVPVKARGITVLRLDHSGKDDARGQRGSSAKESDVDVVWRLARDSEHTFNLECQKTRSGHISFGQIINLERLYEPNLHHLWDVRIDIPLSQYESLVRQLDRLGVSPSLGREKARKILRDNGVSASNEKLGAAILARRNAARKAAVQQSGTVQDEWTEEKPF